MGFLTVLKQIWDNKQFLIGALLVLFIVLFLKQCSKTKEVESKLASTEIIANQNIAALKDKEIQLRLTRDQLKIVDSNLYIALNKVDSISKIKSKTITIAEPIYLGKDIVIPADLIYDSINNLYGLKFKSEDMVRTINGVSWFKVENSDKKLVIKANETKLNDFKLNFALVISQYDDPTTKFTKTKILPFNVNPDGTVGELIPESLLKIDFRNAEVLDKPFTPNKPNDPAVKNSKIQTGFALTISPLAFGMYPTTSGIGFGYTPNIGISYYITFKKK